MIAATLLLLVPSASPSAQVDVVYTLSIPGMYIRGEPYRVTVTATSETDKPVSVPTWALTPAAFDLDGVALEQRTESFLTLVPGQTVQSSLDLGRAISASKSFQGRDFRLGFAADKAHQPVNVAFLEAAEKGIDFMTLPKEQLGDYDVVLSTLHGPIWVQLWPDVAPNHVRNFLDLSYTGFYDDSAFHRVIPGFMIQGGGEKPGRPAPRRVKNEFSDRRHVPGVLSMARLPVDIRDGEGNLVPAFDTATCEFFVMHAVYPSLDGKYTAFGKVVSGMDNVEKVVDSVRPTFTHADASTHEPKQRQTIRKAVVVKAPKRRPTESK